MRDSVSVAMATYNGEKYIKEQIDTILVNLQENDELIISDDGSTDNTREIIKEFTDTRIRLIDGPKKGVKKNFENAINACNGKYIFLCDQDDIWNEKKVETVLRAFSEGVKVVVHDCTLVNDEGKVIVASYFDYRSSKAGVLKNIWKNSYMGCCMAFDSDIKETILPIPEKIEMHDQWIGILGDRLGKNIFIRESLIKYRRHDENVSDCFNHYGFFRMLSNRIRLVYELLKRK